MFKKRKKQRDQIEEIAREASKRVEEIQKNATEHCDRADQAVANMAMKIRQYDSLMEMEYEDNYVDPVTGKVNKFIEFERNRDIYSEHLQDTGSPFDM